MMDLDDLKAINDRLGHFTGDRALRGVGDGDPAGVRRIDTAARYGGDEFVVLLPETDPTGAFVLAEKIRIGVNAMTIDLPDAAHPSISIGVVSPENGQAAVRAARKFFYSFSCICSSWTHLFSASVVNDFRFGYVRINNSLINLPPDDVTADAVGIDRPTSNITNSIYKFTLGSSGFQIGPTPPANQFQTQNNYNFVETLSWVRGKHTWRFGGEYTRVNIDKQFPQVFNGQLFFVNTAGVAPTESEPVGVGGLTDFQKVLAGQVDFSFGGGGVYNHQYRTNNYSFFVQDDWKVNQQLTVNLGLRTEVIGAFHDNLCHIGNFDLALANAGEYPLIYGGCANKLNVAGMTGSGSDTTLKNDYTTGLGPRFGFAWDVFGHHNTTVRGGYGIYFVREDVGTVDQLSFQAPILPIAFSGGPAGCMAQFFKINPTGTPSCPTPPNPNPNGLPTAGVLDPSFLPCLGTITGFSGGTDNFPDICLCQWQPRRSTNSILVRSCGAP